MKRIVPKTKNGFVVFTNSRGTRYTVGKTIETPFEAAFFKQSKKWTEQLLSKIEGEIGQRVCFVYEGSFSK